MATHSSILARISTWTEEPGGLQSVESQKTKRHSTHTGSVHVRENGGNTV